MNKSTFLIVLSGLVSCNFCRAQSYEQDFDGNDTSVYNSIFVHIDTGSKNIWQIGSPHKQIFNSAYSLPNVIVTDTSLPYPINDTSTFMFKIPLMGFHYGGFALQWVQKVDMDSARDGGIVEVSIDNGNSWQNVFNVPFIYDFYGYQNTNVDTLASGVVAFSGTDTSWEDIWLCFNLQTIPQTDTLQFRFTFVSDSINSNREGWIIDNLSTHITELHPIMQVNKDTLLMVYPRMTAGPVYIKPKTEGGTLKIKEADLIDESGQTVEQFKIGPGDSYINISNHASGWYFLTVTTSAAVKTYSIWLHKQE